MAAALSEGVLPHSFNWSDTRLIERALPFIALAPSRIASPSTGALPQSESEQIIRDVAGGPHSGQWLDNLPGNPPALQDFAGESGRNAD
jgi:hypothetical protein